MANLVSVEEVKDNMPAKVPSVSSDPLIQRYIELAEARVTVELEGYASPGTNNEGTMASIVLDLATARAMFKLFGRDPDMRALAIAIRDGANATIEAFKVGGETPQEQAQDAEDEELFISPIHEDYLFDYSTFNDPVRLSAWRKTDLSE